MKILTTENYKGLLSLIGNQKKEIESLRATIRQIKDEQIKELEAIALERDKLKLQLHYSMLNNYYSQKTADFIQDISFPNSEERGSDGPETPLNFPDIF